MLLPVLTALGSALGGMLSGLGAWIIRRARKSQAKELIITIESSDGSTDELRVPEKDEISAQQAAAWLLPTLERHVGVSSHSFGSPAES
jgi:hypothetical protein